MSEEINMLYGVVRNLGSVASQSLGQADAVMDVVDVTDIKPEQNKELLRLLSFDTLQGCRMFSYGLEMMVDAKTNFFSKQCKEINKISSSQSKRHCKRLPDNDNQPVVEIGTINGNEFIEPNIPDVIGELLEIHDPNIMPESALQILDFNIHETSAVVQDDTGFGDEADFSGATAMPISRIIPGVTNRTCSSRLPVNLSIPSFREIVNLPILQQDSTSASDVLLGTEAVGIQNLSMQIDNLERNFDQLMHQEMLPVEVGSLQTGNEQVIELRKDETNVEPNKDQMQVSVGDTGANHMDHELETPRNVVSDADNVDHSMEGQHADPVQPVAAAQQVAEINEVVDAVPPQPEPARPQRVRLENNLFSIRRMRFPDHTTALRETPDMRKIQIGAYLRCMETIDRLLNESINGPVIHLNQSPVDNRSETITGTPMPVVDPHHPVHVSLPTPQIVVHSTSLETSHQLPQLEDSSQQMHSILNMGLIQSCNVPMINDVSSVDVNNALNPPDNFLNTSEQLVGLQANSPQSEFAILDKKVKAAVHFADDLKYLKSHDANSIVRERCSSSEDAALRIATAFELQNLQILDIIDDEDGFIEGFSLEDTHNKENM